MDFISLYEGSNIWHEKEAIVVCSNNNVTTGITVWDICTGQQLCHWPTCASPRHGLLCLGNQYLVATQVQKPGAYTGGAIFIWALNKFQVLHRSYPVEPVGPIASTSDGAYLVGGTPSGNIIIWEVASGRLLCWWPSHNNCVSCLVFSDDDSLLVSGADDGIIHVWPLISTLDMEGDSQGTGHPSCLHSWADHQSRITDLAVTSGGSNSVVISCSLDCTCKVWSIGQGLLLQTFSFSTEINAVILDPGEKMLFSGSSDGTIFVNEFEIGLQEDTSCVTEDQSCRMSGHQGSITALAFSSNGLWLISASEDCTARIWDVVTRQIIRTFEHKKGQITNIVVVPQALFLAKDCRIIGSRRSLPRIPFSSLEKSSRRQTAFDGISTFLPSYCSLEEGPARTGYQSLASMLKQINDLEQELTPEAIQLKVEITVENRSLATNMVKHLVKVNEGLKSKYFEMVQSRLCSKSDEVKGKKRKRMNNDIA